MDKVFCWRRRIDQNDYLLLVLTSSVDATKKIAREAGLSGPRKFELVDMSLTDPELADTRVEPDVLYIADEEAIPIKFQEFQPRARTRNSHD